MGGTRVCKRTSTQSGHGRSIVVFHDGPQLESEGVPCYICTGLGRTESAPGANQNQRHGQGWGLPLSELQDFSP